MESVVAGEALGVVNVVYTTAAGTRIALRAAKRHAKDLGFRIRVLVLQVVPYPLQIDEPTVVSRTAIERIFEELTSESRHSEFTLEYAFCRDYETGLARMLDEHSVVIIGGKRGVVASRDERLARTLRVKDHQVLFVPSENESFLVRWICQVREFLIREASRRKRAFAIGSAG
jgi:hypothetical protein